MNKFSKAALLVISAFLSACSHLQDSTEPQPSISWEQHKTQLQTINAWDISGKIGIRTPEESNSASLKWLQQQQSYQIDIRGPLGQGGASIAGKPNHVSVDIAGEGSFSGPSPEYILYSKLGWDIPISDIYWWVRGLPAPDKPYQHTLLDNRLNELQQAGWTVQYVRYNSLSPSLPRKLRLSRGDLRITLVINSWILS